MGKCEDNCIPTLMLNNKTFSCVVGSCTQHRKNAWTTRCSKIITKNNYILFHWNSLSMKMCPYGLNLQPCSLLYVVAYMKPTLATWVRGGNNCSEYPSPYPFHPLDLLCDATLQPLCFCILWIHTLL